MDVPMVLARILISEHSDPQMIFLREVDGDRGFPIIIGISEALAIDRRLKGLATPRPMTHDLLSDVIEQMGGRVERITISDLREHTFIATLHIAQDGRTLEIDSRPSDAIALGAALGTPIFVAEDVLEELTRSARAAQEQNIHLIREHLAALEERILKMEYKLADDEFVRGSSREVLEHLTEQLSTANKERMAIRRLLEGLD